MKIALAADHGGVEYKVKIRALLAQKGFEVIDIGPESSEAVDYPDFASEVARRVSCGEADEGILVCKSGIGMSIAANKFHRVRAALCTTPEMAKSARVHNHANILTIGAIHTPFNDVQSIVDTWLVCSPESGGRHQRRVEKINHQETLFDDPIAVSEIDPEVYETMCREAKRQKDNIELIASENYTSLAVRQAQGSAMTNKYAEGYPKKRWYHGCEHVDDVEQLAISRAKKLFGGEHVNVQPHSGSAANMAVYFSVLEPEDTIMAMSLAEGGHLTHGHKLNFSGRFFNIVPYGVRKETELIDYDQIVALAEEHKPKLICAGASAYSRTIDFQKLREIADRAGALLMVDMAHIAGLVAGGTHPNPVPYSDFVTTTTHKTLRGPRGGLVICREAFAQDLDRQVFPGIQGGPLMHVIAAKAVCLHEALQPAFRAYAKHVVHNAKTMSLALGEKGLRIVSGDTDNHLLLVDLSPIHITGKQAATALDKALITVNKNAIPFDTQSPFVTSGIRIGTPAITTRGMREKEMKKIAGFIADILTHIEDERYIANIRDHVLELTDPFPIFSDT
ncbi:MAG: ribose 5-phosphate isomerase B [Kiritimatiellae bacterium]|nr:ribose 5-phosphate isomerase B [Kiritimatiellia bacterium]